VRGVGWTHWAATETGVVALAVAALPLSLVVAGVLVGWRTRKGVARGDAWRRSLLEVGLVHGTLPWVCLTMLQGPRAGEVTGAVSLVPLRDLQTMSTLQVVGNLLVFSALGLLAPLRFKAMRSLTRVLVVAGAGSVLIETAQYVLRLDRVSSVDDVLLNTTGAGVAALVTLPWVRSVVEDVPAEGVPPQLVVDHQVAD
jgi:hypothetical protein